jgi:DNA-binding transcriptional ArsR family regulator
MLGGDPEFEYLVSAATIFAALGDPVRLSIVRQLCEGGPLPTVQLKKGAGGVSRQGITKHLHVLEDAGLVESSRLGRDRQWKLQDQQIAALRQYLDQISAQWDARLERLRVLVEDNRT